jgi:hypothetical protein
MYLYLQLGGPVIAIAIESERLGPFIAKYRPKSMLNI